VAFGVIYVATNTVTGKQYVGLTRMSVAIRWAQHVGKARNPKTYFHRAIAKLSASCMGRRYDASVIARMAESKKRKICCDTTGVVYACRKTAATACNVGERSILRVCGGEYPSVKGLKFSYVE
jgi:hypothetical protein